MNKKEVCRMNTLSGLLKEAEKFLADKNRRKLVMVLAPVIIIVLWVGGNFLASENDGLEIRSAKVKRGQVTIKIIESGELRAQDQVTISAVADKQILWLVPEGKWVEKGDTLVRFESEKYEIARGEAESMVIFANAALARATSDLEAQQLQEDAFRKKFEMLPELAKKGFIMDYEVEKARLGLIEMKSKTRSLEATVEATRAHLARVEQAYAQQERKFRLSVVLAPRAGLVVYATTGDEENRKKIGVGMTPLEGMDLIYLPDVSSMLVDIQASEVDLAKLKVGLSAEVRLDAYPEAVFKGEIKTIADLAKRKLNLQTGRASGAKIFDVTVRVLDGDVRLKPGLTATLDIMVNEYDNALHIPVEGVFFDGQKKPFVYVKQRGKITPRNIVIGESNDRYVVIKEGLQEGEEILLGRPSAI
jgi:RND family efflux transporter MFP subunit